jgi:hypothetical protein
MNWVHVERFSDDGLSVRRWSFSLWSNDLVLRDYVEGTRPTKRHKIKGKGWYADDERSYRSELPRPTDIPDDVIDEAVRQIQIGVFIGWTRPEHLIATRSLK